jgi:hypothetical protein
MEPDQDARALYLSIEALFQANKESRDVVLEQEFHSLSQGDLSIDAYAQQMKRTADALREVGHTVSPAQLVLNLLRGLDSRFANTADIISNTSPLPTFKSATNMLRVKELRLGTAHKEASSSALVTSTASSCTSSSCSSTLSNSSSGGSGKGKGKGKGGRGGNGGGGGGSNGGRRNQQQGGGRQGPSQAGPWVCYNPWAQPQQQQWAPQPQQQWVPQPQQQQAHTAFAPAQYSTAGTSSGSWGTTPPGGWNSAGLIAALNQLAVREPSPWVMDSGATSHMTSNDGILLSRLPSPPSSITVGNGHSIPIISRGTSTLHLADHPLQLHNVLVAPQLTHNLLSVRQLTRDNNCSIEFDASGLSVKDLLTQTVLLRCNSNGDLYTIQHRTPPRCHVAVVSPELWHSRLGHPAPAVVQTLNKFSAIQCNKAARRLCHACQLGKRAKLPFNSSVSSTSAPFELVHCDVWTSPVFEYFWL